MFPPFVRNVDDALAYIDDWVRLTGGWRTSGLVVERRPGGLVAIRQFEIDYGDDRVLSVSMTLDAELRPLYYRFHLSAGGAFVWRLDQHVGHEDEHGGPTHVHVGPSQHDRRPHRPVTLADVADTLRTGLR